MDAGASIALTDSKYIWVVRYAAACSMGTHLSDSVKAWRRFSTWNGRFEGGGSKCTWPTWLCWYTTDNIGGYAQFEDAVLSSDSIAFLQYTSGSTSAPKGVVVTHSALSHNLFITIRAANHNTVAYDAFQRGLLDKSEPIDVESWVADEPGTIVSWLPQYHDMGLIGNILAPLVVPGMALVRMSPLSFLKNPLVWAKAITQYRATVITAPDFGYSQLVKYAMAACAKGDLEVSSYDFSHVRLALNGAGMVRYKTMCDFISLFGRAGLKENAYGGAYGLAEHCCFMCHGGRTVLYLDRNVLAENKAKQVKDEAIGLGGKLPADVISLMSCGRPYSDVDTRIVCPTSRMELQAGEVGEIWVNSPSVAGGYWNMPEETERVFGAALTNTNGHSAVGFLRTGDLGFIWNGELYFVSRMKDLIVIHGRNIVPDDVELAISQSCQHIRPGCIAVFQTEEDIMSAVAEVRASEMPDDQAQEIERGVKSAIRQNLGISLDSLVLVKPRTIPKTTSGKVRRSECRRLFMANALGDISVRKCLEKSPAPALDPKILTQLPLHEAQNMVLARALEITSDFGLRLRPSDNLTGYGVDSSVLISLHKKLEDTFSCSLPVTLVLEHPDLLSISCFVAKEIFVSHGRSVEDDSRGVSAPSAAKGKPRSFVSYVLNLSTLLYAMVLVVLALNTERTVDGEPFSLWKQLPLAFFKSCREELKGFRLLDGIFGRQIDGFNLRFNSFVFELLGFHLFTTGTLLLARRIPAVSRKWSPAAITIAVSLFHVFCVHGILASWSLTTMAINYAVCRAVLPYAKQNAAMCRWIIWVTVLLLLAINNVLDVNFRNAWSMYQTYFAGLPPEAVFGVVRLNLKAFTPFSSFRYLALRLLSYSLDVIDAESRVEDAEKGTIPSTTSRTHPLMEYWAYILYAPLNLHGPLMQFRHFQKCPAARVHIPSDVSKGHETGMAIRVPPPAQGWVYGLKSLAGMLGWAFVCIIALETIYMPSVVFMHFHNPDFTVVPANLLDYEYFAHLGLFGLALFMQSYVVFGVPQALAALDSVVAPHDNPVSYLRALTSVRALWSKFHVSWRDFFVDHIFMRSSSSTWGAVKVFAFSAWLHGFDNLYWHLYFGSMCVVFILETLFHKYYRKHSPSGKQNKLLAGIYQNLMFGFQLLFYPAFYYMTDTDTGDMRLSLWGLKMFLIYNLPFCILNSWRISYDADGFW